MCFSTNGLRGEQNDIKVERLERPGHAHPVTVSPCAAIGHRPCSDLSRTRSQRWLPARLTSRFSNLTIQYSHKIHVPIDDLSPNPNRPSLAIEQFLVALEVLRQILSDLPSVIPCGAGRLIDTRNTAISAIAQTQVPLDAGTYRTPHPFALALFQRRTARALRSARRWYQRLPPQPSV